jgi:nucleotide-binding universal stress UspA family protein
MTMRIVLGTDGSASSAEACHLVASLRWPAGTTITLVTAYELPMPGIGPALAGGDWLLIDPERLRTELEAQLAELAAPLESRGLAVERQVVTGRAATVIVDTARELGADLVVLGSRGHGPIATMLLGSVSAEVAERAECSVLIARSGEIGRLLVATDGSECAGIVADELGAWGTFRDLPATCLSVVPADSPAFALMVDLYTLGSEPLEAERKAQADAHERHAREMAVRLAASGIRATSEVRSGDAAHEIIQAAEAHRADLVVTGSRGLHGLDLWLLGSVARNVLLHTKASVLIVRRPHRPADR